MSIWNQLRSLFADVGGEAIVRIGENTRGGFSIFPVNDVAVRLFNGDGEAGNFGTYADAYKRAARDNCWTVVELAIPKPSTQRPQSAQSQSLCVTSVRSVTPTPNL